MVPVKCWLKPSGTSPIAALSSAQYGGSITVDEQFRIEVRSLAEAARRRNGCVGFDKLRRRGLVDYVGSLGFSESVGGVTAVDIEDVAGDV